MTCPRSTRQWQSWVQPWPLYLVLGSTPQRMHTWETNVFDRGRRCQGCWIWGGEFLWTRVRWDFTQEVGCEGWLALGSQEQLEGTAVFLAFRTRCGGGLGGESKCVSCLGDHARNGGLILEEWERDWKQVSKLGLEDILGFQAEIWSWFIYLESLQIFEVGARWYAPLYLV